MKTKMVVIGIIVIFAMVLGIVLQTAGAEVTSSLGFILSFALAFAFFDYVIYRIATWAQGQSKGKRIAGYVLAGYIAVGAAIAPFVISPLSKRFSSGSITIIFGIAEIAVLAGIAFVLWSRNKVYEDEQEEFAPTAPLYLDDMDGHTFEHFCADLLRSNGFGKISLTPTSGDQGVDILAEKSGLKFAFQCKKWSSSIGNTAVQEVAAGKAFYKCDIGVVITNSTFTHGAVELAKATGVLLWDRVKLQELMNEAAAPDEEMQEKATTVFNKKEYQFTCGRCGHVWYMTGGEIREAKAAKRSVQSMKIKRMSSISARKINDISTRLAILEPATAISKCPACGSHSVTKSKA